MNPSIVKICPMGCIPIVAAIGIISSLKYNEVLQSEQQTRSDRCGFI